MKIHIYYVWPRNRKQCDIMYNGINIDTRILHYCFKMEIL